MKKPEKQDKQRKKKLNKKHNPTKNPSSVKKEDATAMVYYTWDDATNDYIRTDKKPNSRKKRTDTPNSKTVESQ